MYLAEAPTPYDVAVLGAGPAGLALAGACAHYGLRVALVAPEPFFRWQANYGIWDAELGDLPETVVEARYPRPLIDLGEGEHIALDAAYLRLDTEGLQDELWRRARAGGVEVRCGKAGDIEHLDSHSVVDLAQDGSVRARLVVDASGAGTQLTQRRDGPAPGFQIAYGELLEVDHHPWAEGEMALMDLSADFDGPPSFLYAMPLGPHRLFAEETVLASEQMLPMSQLKARLHSRLASYGIASADPLAREHCVIPLGLPLPLRGQRVLAFGAAASMVQPSSGYQLGQALRLAPQVAEALAAGLERSPTAALRAAQQVVWPRARVRAWDLYRFGMHALCRLDLSDTRSFLRAFFSLPGDSWQRFMQGQQPSRAVAMAMLRVFLRAPWRLRRALAGIGNQPHASGPRRELAQETKP